MLYLQHGSRVSKVDSHDLIVLQRLLQMPVRMQKEATHHHHRLLLYLVCRLYVLFRIVLDAFPL